MIYGDVYCVGFGLDYSEFDVWWLINKRQYMKSNAKIIYYNPANKNDTNKNKLLKAMGIDLCSLKYDSNHKIDYTQFYKKVF